nr:4-phospho-D-threonate 3-dehydrogenase [Desulfitobacterium hafniense]
MNRPIIGIPLGDPAGVGPEIVVKALASKEIYEISRPVVIGDSSTVLRALEICELEMDVHFIDDPDQGLYEHGTID